MVNSLNENIKPKINTDKMTTLIEAFYPPHEGEGNYVCFSYAHKDAKSVIPDMVRFMKSGIPIYCDEWKSPYRTGRKDLEKRISTSSLLVAFMSDNAAESKFFNLEICIGAENGIPILPIHLEKTTSVEDSLMWNRNLPPPICRFRLGEEEHMKKCIEEFKKSLKSGRRSKRRRIGYSFF